MNATKARESAAYLIQLHATGCEIKHSLHNDLIMQHVSIIRSSITCATLDFDKLNFWVKDQKLMP